MAIALSMSAPSHKQVAIPVVGGVLSSILFHVMILIVLGVGLPFVAKDPLIVAPPIIVELVEFDEITQTDRVAQPIPPKDKLPEEAPKPTPQARPQAPKMTAETSPDLTRPEAPELEEELVPPPPSETPAPLERKKIEKPKPKPVKVPKKKPVTAKPKTQANDFQSLLKNLTPDVTEGAEKAKDLDPDIKEEAPAPQGQIAPLSNRITVSEEDALRQQLSQCWNILAGGKYAENLVVEIRLVVNPDRTVNQAVVLDRGRYNRDAAFRAAADSALRALRNPRCSPLALPPEKYEQWRNTVINFDPRDIL